jgi:hypothetical protein
MTNDPWIRADFVEDGVGVCRCTGTRSTIGEIRGLGIDKRGQEAQGGENGLEKHGASRELGKRSGCIGHGEDVI